MTTAPRSNALLLLFRLIAKAFFLLALAYDIFSLLVYALIPQLQRLAFSVGGFRMLPPFADLRWVTFLSGCGINLKDLAEGKHLVGCYPYDRGGLGYPPLSIEFARFLHIQDSHTGVLGLTLGLASIAVLISFLRRLHRPGCTRDLFGGLILLSFPVQLALERSNIDLVVFILLISLAAALSSLKRWAIPFAAGISWLAVGIKLYPIVGITLWLGLNIRQRPRLVLIKAASLLGAALGLATALPWFLSYGKGAAQPAAGPISHGFMVPLHLERIINISPLLGKIAQIAPQPIIGLIIFILTLFWCKRVHLSAHWEEIILQCAEGYSGRFLRTMPSLLGSVWLGCFFLSSSYDYRLILALPSLICLLSVLDSASNKQSCSYSFILTLVVFGGFTSFLLPLIYYSGFLPIELKIPASALFLISDIFVMPAIAASIAILIFPIAKFRTP